MSLLFKKVLQKIKDFETKEKIDELNVNSILENNWEQHFYNKVYKKDDIVYLNLAVKKRNSCKNCNFAQRI